MKEKGIQNEVRVALSKDGFVVFRNNVGLLTLVDKRKIRVGLCKGSSDLIGFKSIVVTPEMVGKKVAVFTAVECKDKSPLTPDQANFIRVVDQAGGIAFVAYSKKDVEQHHGF